MKRVTVWIVGAGIASVPLMFSLQAKERRSKAPAPAEPASTTQPAPTAPPEQVAFTFTDETQMQQFAKLWQQRQAAITRMAVLQVYWDQEQAGLQLANEQLLSQYNLDVSKNYTLNTERKILIERETPPVEPTAQLGQTPAQTQAASSAKKNANN